MKLATKFLGKESLNSLNLKRMWTIDRHVSEGTTNIYTLLLPALCCVPAKFADAGTSKKP